MPPSIKALFSVLKEDMYLSLWFEFWGWKHWWLFCVCSMPGTINVRRLCRFIDDLISSSQRFCDIGMIVNLTQAELRWWGQNSHMWPPYHSENPCGHPCGHKEPEGFIGEGRHVCFLPRLWVEGFGSISIPLTSWGLIEPHVLDLESQCVSLGDGFSGNFCGFVFPRKPCAKLI